MKQSPIISRPLFDRKSIKKIWQEIEKQLKTKDIAIIETDHFVDRKKHHDAIAKENNLLDIFQKEGAIREITIRHDDQGVGVDVQSTSFTGEKRIQFTYSPRADFALRPKKKTKVESLSIYSRAEQPQNEGTMIHLENMVIGHFRIGYFDPKDKDGRISSILLKDITINQATHVVEVRRDWGNQVRAWEMIVKEIYHIRLQGQISFSNNLNIDHKVCEYLYQHFKKEGRVRLAETLYRNMLEKYKKMKSTPCSDKVILWARYLLSDHQTNILRPILWISLILFFLGFISAIYPEHFPEGLSDLMLPWVYFNDLVPKQFQDNALASFLTKTTYLLVKVVSTACYFQIIMMLKKFAFKNNTSEITYPSSD